MRLFRTVRTILREFDENERAMRRFNRKMYPQPHIFDFSFGDVKKYEDWNKQMRSDLRWASSKKELHIAGILTKAIKSVNEAMRSFGAAFNEVARIIEVLRIKPKRRRVIPFNRPNRR